MKQARLKLIRASQTLTMTARGKAIQHYTDEMMRIYPELVLHYIARDAHQAEIRRTAEAVVARILKMRIEWRAR